jgi:hypothetical protein
MITDLFSHKIHSSGIEWPDKLVELATIFNEFDGQRYDRNAIELKLLSISPRIAVSAGEVLRDRSKLRDEISAYPAYLGLYRLQYDGSQWLLFLSEAAKKFLTSDEPDVGAFMRLQLTLFQYPNGMGVAYSAENARYQANARNRTLELISEGIHISPFRLICRALIADARLRNVDILDGDLGIGELYSLVNHLPVNKSVAPSIALLLDSLREIRAGRILPPEQFESRFHILDHTEMIGRDRDKLSFRVPENDEDREDLLQKISAVVSVESQFDGFDRAHSGDDLMAVIESGAWGSYFDGLRTISAETVSVLASDTAMAISELGIRTPSVGTPVFTPAPLRYPFRTHTVPSDLLPATSRREDLADPEATRVKRERRTLAHKLMMSTLGDLLRRKGAKPMESPHIDLYAEIPNDGAYLFEIKSGGENLLAQIRKGISQLYEYRFRYRDDIRADAILCLVLPDAPTGIPWLEDYVCNDRGISICWLDEIGQIKSATSCEDKLRNLVNAPFEDSG